MIGFCQHKGYVSGFAWYLWHIGAHIKTSPDWGIDFLDIKYFDIHLKRLRDAKADRLA